MVRIELAQVSPCSGCGNCCRHIGLPPFEAANPDLGPQPKVRRLSRGAPEDTAELADLTTFALMPDALRAEHAALLRGLTEDPSGRPCAWLDEASGECLHYEFRPFLCREWAVGALPCVHVRKSNHPVVWVDSSPVAVWRNPQSERRYRGRATHPCD